jgi:hypothetical protein
MPSRLHRSALVALTLSLPAPTAVTGQSASPATTYRPRFTEFWNIKPSEELGAEVHGVTLRRETGEIILEEGRLNLFHPIDGQVFGAVFSGKGRFRMAPRMPIEQERLRLYHKTPTLDEPFTDVVFLFADTTLQQLRRSLAFGPTPSPEVMGRQIRLALDYLGDEDDEWLDPDVLQSILNGGQTGMFYAHMSRDGGDPWMFRLDPQEFEGVQFLARPRHIGFERWSETVVQEPFAGDTVRTGGRAERRAEARVQKYQMAIRLPQTGTGEVDFRALATLTIRADTSVGPWIPFRLYGKLTVDSARWATGAAAEVTKRKDSPILWVRLERPLARGDTVSLRLAYRGDLVDRFGNWFFVKSSIAWYPVAMDSRRTAVFDLEFESPEGFTLASVGVRTDSAAAPGHMVRTRWVSEKPIRNASFNLGLYESHTVREGDLPPVTVLWSDDMHRLISQGGRVLQGKNMKQQVGGDLLAAIQFYRSVFGDPPFAAMYATEIPALHGEAFPGLVGLSFVTFQQTSDQGFDEAFRGHEAAHQWWGIGVDYATYRDRWLSEGLAEFSGLWFLQARRKDTGKYFDLLDRMRASIMLRRDDPLPIWLGHRVTTATTGDDYSAIVYSKGAWVMHMLRTLLLDLKTMNEARFTTVMREYWSEFRGGAASTADLQRVVERVSGQKMDWFFRQWIHQSAIPTYRYAWHAEQVEGGWQVRLRVDQERVPPEFLMYVPVAVELGNDQVARARVKVTGARSEVTLPLIPAKPKALKFNDLHGVLAEVKETSW